MDSSLEYFRVVPDVHTWICFYVQHIFILIIFIPQEMTENAGFDIHGKIQLRIRLLPNLALPRSFATNYHYYYNSKIKSWMERARF